MCSSRRSGCSEADRNVTSSGGPAADVPPSAATGAAVEPLRAHRWIRSSAARHRAWRVTGVTIWPVRSRTQRSVVGAAPVSSSSGLVVHAQREGSKSARSPGTGTGRCRVTAGTAGLAVFAQGMAVRRIETRSGSTRSATARSGAAGCARALPRQLRSHGPTAKPLQSLQAAPDPATTARVAPAIRGCRPSRRAKYDRPNEPSRTLLADWPQPVPAPLADGWPRGAVDRGRSLDRSVGVRPHPVTALAPHRRHACSWRQTVGPVLAHIDLRSTLCRCCSSSGMICAAPSRFGLTSTDRRKNSSARRGLPNCR